MDSFLGPKQVVLPQVIADKLYEEGAIMVGLYCIMARNVSKRGRARMTRDQIIEDSKLDTNTANLYLNWLWREGIIEYHQIISENGEITDEFFYIVSQDKTGGRGGD